jgi:hypothetical protein
MSDTNTVPFKVIYDCATKEESIIPLTAEEIEAIQVQQAVLAEQEAYLEAQKEAKNIARAAAFEKLKALGLTDEEISALSN